MQLFIKKQAWCQILKHGPKWCGNVLLLKSDHTSLPRVRVRETWYQWPESEKEHQSWMDSGILEKTTGQCEPLRIRQGDLLELAKHSTSQSLLCLPPMASMASSQPVEGLCHLKTRQPEQRPAFCHSELELCQEIIVHHHSSKHIGTLWWDCNWEFSSFLFWP